MINLAIVFIGVIGLLCAQDKRAFFELNPKIPKRILKGWHIKAKLIVHPALSMILLFFKCQSDTFLLGYFQCPSKKRFKVIAISNWRLDYAWERKPPKIPLEASAFSKCQSKQELNWSNPLYLSSVETNRLQSVNSELVIWTFFSSKWTKYSFCLVL